MVSKLQEDMLAEGQQAPDFTLPGATRTGQDVYQLEDLAGEGVAILSFYPFDFSPVCTTQLCDLRDIEWFQIEDGVDVVGVSCDSAYAHERFIDEYDLPFPLLSDFSGDVIEAFDVKQGRLDEHRGVPKRSVFVVDGDREIVYNWVRDELTETPPLDDIADEVRSLI